MKTAQVRELKNKTSELLRQAATQDVIITSRGKPFACLIGLHPSDVAIRSRARSGNNADEGYRKEALRILSVFDRKVKPDKGKRWIAKEEHDLVLYDGFEE
jgi:prevent-host-death family protein